MNKKTNITNNKPESFPFIRLTIGSFIGAFLGYARFIGQTGHIDFMFRQIAVIFIFLFLMFGLPMCIAYSRQLKSREWVYSWCFFGSFIPFGTVIFVIALLYSLISRKKDA